MAKKFQNFMTKKRVLRHFVNTKPNLLGLGGR